MLRRLVAPKPGVGGMIDWSNPITSRLCFVNLYNEQGAIQCQNLVGQTRAPFTGSTGPSWRGNSLSFPGGANTVGYLTYGAETFCTDLGRNTSNPVTLFFRYNPTSVAAGSLAGRNDGNTVSAGWQISLNANSLMYTHESSVTNMNTLIATPVGRFSTIAIISDGSLTSANQLFYVDGILTSHSSDTNGAGTPGSDAAQTLYIGRGNANYGLGNTCFVGFLEYFYIFKRMLNPAEVKSLTVNPYQFVEKRDVFAARVAAAAGVAEKTSFFIFAG